MHSVFLDEIRKSVRYPLAGPIEKLRKSADDALRAGVDLRGQGVLTGSMETARALAVHPTGEALHAWIALSGSAKVAVGSLNTSSARVQ